MSDSKRQCQLDQIDAYSLRVSRLSVLIESLEAKALEGDEAVPRSIQDIAFFLGDEIRATKAEQDRLFAEMAGGES